MTILRFRICWEEDDQTYRDIEIEGHQSFLEFHKCIIKSYEFDGKHTASFFVSSDKWNYGLEINSEIMVNKKGADALSMTKTTVSALISLPDQKFIYVYNPDKKWCFHIELLNVSSETTAKRIYPFILRSEGIAPAQYGIKGVNVDKLVEIEEKYDVGIAAILQGLGEDGEDESTSSETDDEANSDEMLEEDEIQGFVE